MNLDRFNSSLDIDTSSLTPPKPTFVYCLVSYLLVFPVFRLLFRGHTQGNENVPKYGSLVVVSNHGSHLDPPLLGHALGRPVSFMAKAELFKIPLIGSIIRMCGAYPVKRGASDREAIRTATKRLNQGWAIGVFLDGTRQVDGRCNNPLSGAALLAARSGSKLLPVAIVNSHRALGVKSIFPRLIPLYLCIGSPIPPPITRKKSDLELTTKKLQESINSMLEKGISN